MKRPMAPLLLAALAVACACSSDASDSDAGATALLFAAGFDGFHSWPSFPAVGPPGMVDAVHTAMPLVAYINKLPPHGSTSFPLGTIIVKEVNAGDLTTRQIFAMWKRGGGFNSSGAVDWEWFELQNLDDPNLPVNIIWRGFGPPSGESYGGDPNTCNSCHEGAQANDYVWTQALQLSSF
jgi:hypothetical protein